VYIFLVSGTTQKSVKEAKALLDYSTEVVPIPQTHVGQILGSAQRHIQHIVDRTVLTGMWISSALSLDVPDFGAFQLTGARRAIADAKMLLDFHIASLRELDELRGVKGPPLAPLVIESSPDLPNKLITVVNPQSTSSLLGDVDFRYL
ncbi:Fragile X mental retardation syndrome protein 1, partial [Fasciolopsis buskii]